ncbi:hypothetical protein AVEN_259293-1 [Araneus ventricosus]|uniref:RNase H type-1 domain-containing protein n=1 Tax=Araneus ventricosus TaxID=182803 RepID=A0A4Y2GIX4_ARAVE|nr:hypothetical protein AVEN_259293-1 [Araneus ventricosus]
MLKLQSDLMNMCLETVNPYELPPWDYSRKSDSPIKDFKSIYTDGSGIGGKIGSGLACLDKEDGILWQKEVRLHNEAAVFLAVAFAVKLALQNIGDEERIRIYTDSQSVLQAMESTRILASIILDIKNILKNKKYVEFYWVRAHVGIHGNEIADTLAKNATKKYYR